MVLDLNLPPVPDLNEALEDLEDDVDDDRSHHVQKDGRIAADAPEEQEIDPG
jgi:hypothetical protein